MAKNRTEQPSVQQDMMVDYLQANHASWSIDTLLAHPTDALAFGLAIAGRMQKVTDADARKVGKIIAQLNEHGAAITEIQRVCLAAMNLRKRGKFRHLLRRKGGN